MISFDYIKKLFCCTSRNQKVKLVENKIDISYDKILESEKINDGNDFLTENFKALSSSEIWLLSDEEIERDMETNINTHSSRCLPVQEEDKPTLALDLDNTLVYVSVKELQNYDHKITINHNGKKQNVWIIERPGLQSFLTKLYDKYEIILFTAGIRQYGIKLLMKIDPELRIEYLLDRRFCTIAGKNQKQQDIYVKNLKILGRNLSKVLIVDDKSYSFCLDPKNGILISYYTGNPNDRALYKLKNYLLKCWKTQCFQNNNTDVGIPEFN